LNYHKGEADLNSMPEWLFEIEEWDLEGELREVVDTKLIIT